MNDKCAAGTGRFLEVMAAALKIDLERMGELSLNTEKSGDQQHMHGFCRIRSGLARERRGEAP